MKTRMLLACVALPAALWANVETHADDWPQWRGPDRLNISQETGLLNKWPEGGPPMIWQAKGLGEGIASVAIQGETLYTLGFQPDGQVVFAINAFTGDLRWTTVIGPLFRQHRLMRWLSQRTPTLDGERLYAFTAYGDLVCLRTDDGRELWRKNYQTDFGAKRPHFGFADYPLVDGEKLICAPGAPEAAMVALNRRTGEVLWEAAGPEEGPRGYGVYGAAIVAEFGGQRQYVNSMHRTLVSISSDGEFLWHKPMFRHPGGGSSTPVVVGDSRLFCASGYDQTVFLLEIDSQGGDYKIQEVYEEQIRLSPFQNNGIVLGDYAYFWQIRPSGPMCMELDTGTVQWEVSGPSSPRGLASVTCADGHLYYLRSDGVALLVEASPKGYSEKGRFTLPDYVDAIGATAPVVANGRLYLRDEDRLFCYDVREDALVRAENEVLKVDLTKQALALNGGRRATRSREQPDQPQSSRAIFVPTPKDVVKKMLELAAPKPDELLCDLGSGDGRILIEAAREYECRALGYEIDPELVKKSRQNVRRAGLDSRVRIEQADFSTADLSEVDVLAVYLPPEVLEKLAPKFKDLKKGARIVSHQFKLPDMTPEHSEDFPSDDDGESHRIFLYKIGGGDTSQLEKATGKVVWQDNSPGTNIFHVQWSSPVALEVEGEGRVLTGFGDGMLRAFDAETGEKLWELDCNPPEHRAMKSPHPEGPSEILATPVYHKGGIYVAIGQEPEHGEGAGNLPVPGTLLESMFAPKSREERQNETYTTTPITHPQKRDYTVLGVGVHHAKLCL